MGEIQTQPVASEPPAKSRPGLISTLSSSSAAAPSSSLPGVTRIRTSIVVDPYVSPVNQNGSFEFDRVIKSGYLQKRSKAKTWRTAYLVLRPNTLSIYKNDKESKLLYQIFLSELTAVTLIRDPKQKRLHIFGIFSPSRNYHFQASSEEEAHEWVERIRTEARIEEEEEEMFLASPAVHTRRPSYGFSAYLARHADPPRTQENDRLSSSPEPQMPRPRRPSQRAQQQQQQQQQQRQNSLPESQSYAGWSGNEMALSDYSDNDQQYRVAGMSFESLAAQSPPSTSMSALPPKDVAQADLGSVRNISQSSGFGNLETDPDRVVWQGWLWFLRSKGGVRQWKNSWAVLRPRNLILYKNESEYAAQYIFPLSSIVNVVERDPLSRTKKHCLEIITEEKTYRFSAHDEETLLQCLGAFKSLLAKRRELEIRAASIALPTTSIAQDSTLLAAPSAAAPVAVTVSFPSPVMQSP